MAGTRLRARGPASGSPVPLLLLAATVALAALMTLYDAGRNAAAGEDTAVAAETSPASGEQALGEPRAPDPIRVRSDAVDITSPTIPLGTREDGRLEVPEDAHDAGWWAGGADPGEPGPAVVVGHVDSRDGPGAFWELPDLEPGDRVTVDREDGTSVHWRVERKETHAKDAFPTEVVYGDTDAPTLRLITCSGFFDPEARSYEDNTIVFLTLDHQQEDGYQGSGDRGAGDQSDGDHGDPSDALAEEAEPVTAGDAAHEQDAGSRGAPAPGGGGGAELAEGLAAVATSFDDGDRGLPVALAALSVLVAGTASIRELLASR